MYDSFDNTYQVLKFSVPMHLDIDVLLLSDQSVSVASYQAKWIALCFHLKC